MPEFPYGRAPLAILVMTLLSGGALLLSGMRGAGVAEPDLTLATFTKEHAEAYAEPIAEFERRRGVRVHVEVVDQRALQSRLQSALQAGADVPDMVELLDGTMGIFTKGPLETVGFVALTERVRQAGWTRRWCPAGLRSGRAGGGCSRCRTTSTRCCWGIGGTWSRRWGST